MQIRNCFILPKNKETAVCGKCGRPVYQNSHYMAHAISCRFTPHDYVKVMREGEPGSYLLQAKEDGLHFMVLAPFTIPHERRTNWYSGGKWVVIFHSVFLKDEKKIIELNKGEKDTLGWLQEIEKKKLPPLHTSTDQAVIKRAFPNFYGLYSLLMFYSIYTGRGIRFVPREKMKLLKEFLSCPGERYHVMADAHYTRYPFYYGKTEYLDSYIISDVRLYDYEEELFFILRIKLPCTDACNSRADAYRNEFSLLIGKDILLSTREVNLRDLLTHSYTAAFQMEALKAFDERYYGYHLCDYMDQGKNLILALSGPGFHKIYELLCGAGLPLAAEGINFDSGYMKRDPFSYKNTKDLFGMPVKLLKKLTEWPSEDWQLEILASTYKSHPGYLNFPTLNVNLTDFLFHNNIGLKDYRRPRTKEDSLSPELSIWNRGNPHKVERIDEESFILPDIVGLENYSENEILRMLRYVYLSPYDYTWYRDYLNITNRMESRPYGITPKDLCLAHNHAVSLYRFTGRKPSARKEDFRQVTKSPEYMEFTTFDLSFPSEEISKIKDPYIIVAPSEPEDLFRESEQMHNCVKTYTDRVLKGQTRIYFLRCKESPAKSYVTIEVKNRRLIQVKAFGNRKVSPAVREFVVEWAKIKNIIYSSCSDLKNCA